MMHLRDYILEAGLSPIKEYILEKTCKFDKGTNDFDQLPTEKLFKNCKNEVFNLVQAILNDYKENNGIKLDFNFIYASEGTYIKMPYAFRDSIINVFDKKGDVTKNFHLINNDLNKVIIKYVNKNGKKTEVIETGSGSLKTVNVRDQELGTCVLWNLFAKGLKGVDEEDIAKYKVDDVNNIMQDYMQSSVKFNEEWTNSFNLQIMTMKNYLTSIKKDPKNYYCERYDGDTSFKDWKVSKAYALLVSTYVKAIGGKKDNYDPTDVILYNFNQTDEILSKLNELYQLMKKDYAEAKKQFIKAFYEDKNSPLYRSLIGVSLKKVSSKKSSFQIFNIGESKASNEVSDIMSKLEIIEKNGKVVVKGNFIFEDIDSSNDEGDKVNTPENIKSNYCVITLRTFGAKSNGTSQIGMDVTMSDSTGKFKGPSLGKVPVRDWINLICDKKAPKNVAEARKYFFDYMKNNDDAEVKKGLSFIVQEAIKVGPNCFPFVLVH